MILRQSLLALFVLAAGCASDMGYEEDCTGGNCDEITVTEDPSCPHTDGIEDLGEVHESEGLSADFYQTVNQMDLWTFQVIDDPNGKNPVVTVRARTVGEGATLDRIDSIRVSAQCEGAVVTCLSGESYSGGIGCRHQKYPGVGGSTTMKFELDCDGIDDSSTISVIVATGGHHKLGYDCMTYQLDVDVE